MVRIVKSRIDYVEHAINFSNRCEFCCSYCYYHSPQSRWKRRRGIGEPTVRQIDRDLDELRRQLESFRPRGDILVSATHEPLGPLTLEVCVDILQTIADLRPDLLPRIRVLSKAGWFNESFSPRLRIPGGVKFGQTITTLHQGTAYLVEPSAAEVSRRIEALKRAKEAGHFVWISAEPCFRGMDLVRLCELVEPDEVWVGKLNHMKSPHALSPQEIYRQVEEAREQGYNVHMKWELRKALKIPEEAEASLQLGLEAYLVEVGER